MFATSSPMKRRQAFKRLKTDEERQQFVEQFWLRRDPDARHRRERIQGRALPPHRLRERPLCFRYSRLENRPRHDLHQVRCRRTKLIRIRRAAAMSARSKKAAAKRLPSRLKLGAIAISRRWHQHRNRIRRYHDERRVSHLTRS